MGDSILETIRKMMGPDGSYDYFDVDLIVHINAAISRLTKIGVGPAEGFSITGTSETWIDFIGDDPKMSQVIQYVYMKTKLAFDPPLNSSLLKAMQESCNEIEWLYCE